MKNNAVFRFGLDLVECDNVDWLDMVLKGRDRFFEVVRRHFVIFDNRRDLELLDSVTDSHELEEAWKNTLTVKPDLAKKKCENENLLVDQNLGLGLENPKIRKV